MRRERERQAKKLGDHFPKGKFRRLYDRYLHAVSLQGWGACGIGMASGMVRYGMGMETWQQHVQLRRAGGWVFVRSRSDRGSWRAASRCGEPSSVPGNDSQWPGGLKSVEGRPPKVSERGWIDDFTGKGRVERKKYGSGGRYRERKYGMDAHDMRTVTADPPYSQVDADWAFGRPAWD